LQRLVGCEKHVVYKELRRAANTTDFNKLIFVTKIATCFVLTLIQLQTTAIFVYKEAT